MTRNDFTENNGDYGAQLDIRSSDRAVASITNAGRSDPLISSDTWNAWADKFDAGEKVFGAAAVIATGVGNGPAAAAAAATAAVAKLGSEIAAQQAKEAKAQEARNAQARAMEKQMRDSVDRGMRDHNDRMSRGDYRDPPSRERMADIGRMA